MHRRWLVAVFALHLFLGVGAFAFGHAQSPEASQAQVQSLVTDVATAANTAFDDTAPATIALVDLVLNDIQSDVPECLDVAIATSGRGAPPHLPSPPLAQDLTPPVLDGPQRPPRGSLPALA